VQKGSMLSRGIRGIVPDQGLELELVASRFSYDTLCRRKGASQSRPRIEPSEGSEKVDGRLNWIVTDV